eukprot:g2264.t1
MDKVLASAFLCTTLGAAHAEVDNGTAYHVHAAGNNSTISSSWSRRTTLSSEREVLSKSRSAPDSSTDVLPLLIVDPDRIGSRYYYRLVFLGREGPYHYALKTGGYNPGRTWCRKACDRAERCTHYAHGDSTEHPNHHQCMLFDSCPQAGPVKAADPDDISDKPWLEKNVIPKVYKCVGICNGVVTCPSTHVQNGDYAWHECSTSPCTISECCRKRKCSDVMNQCNDLGSVWDVNKKNVRCGTAAQCKSGETCCTPLPLFKCSDVVHGDEYCADSGRSVRDENKANDDCGTSEADCKSGQTCCRKRKCSDVVGAHTDCTSITSGSPYAYFKNEDKNNDACGTENDCKSGTTCCVQGCQEPTALDKSGYTPKQTWQGVLSHDISYPGHGTPQADQDVLGCAGTHLVHPPGSHPTAHCEASGSILKLNGCREKCSHFTCPDHYILRDDAHARKCSTHDCGDSGQSETNRDTCCTERKCSDVVSSDDDCVPQANRRDASNHNVPCGTEADCKSGQTCCTARKCKHVYLSLSSDWCDGSVGGSSWFFDTSNAEFGCGTVTQCSYDACCLQKCLPPASSDAYSFTAEGVAAMQTRQQSYPGSDAWTPELSILACDGSNGFLGSPTVRCEAENATLKLAGCSRRLCGTSDQGQTPFACISPDYRNKKNYAEIECSSQTCSRDECCIQNTCAETFFYSGSGSQCPAFTEGFLQSAAARLGSNLCKTGDCSADHAEDVVACCGRRRVCPYDEGITEDELGIFSSAIGLQLGKYFNISKNDVLTNESADGAFSCARLASPLHDHHVSHLSTEPRIDFCQGATCSSSVELDVAACCFKYVEQEYMFCNPFQTPRFYGNEEAARRACNYDFPRHVCLGYQEDGNVYNSETARLFLNTSLGDRVRTALDLETDPTQANFVAPRSRRDPTQANFRAPRLYGNWSLLLTPKWLDSNCTTAPADSRPAECRSSLGELAQCVDLTTLAVNATRRRQELAHVGLSPEEAPAPAGTTSPEGFINVARFDPGNLNRVFLKTRTRNHNSSFTMEDLGVNLSLLFPYFNMDASAKASAKRAGQSIMKTRLILPEESVETLKQSERTLEQAEFDGAAGEGEEEKPTTITAATSGDGELSAVTMRRAMAAALNSYAENETQGAETEAAAPTQERGQLYLQLGGRDGAEKLGRRGSATSGRTSKKEDINVLDSSTAVSPPFALVVDIDAMSATGEIPATDLAQMLNTSGAAAESLMLLYLCRHNLLGRTRTRPRGIDLAAVARQKRKGKGLLNAGTEAGASPPPLPSGESSALSGGSAATGRGSSAVGGGSSALGGAGSSAVGGRSSALGGAGSSAVGGGSWAFGGGSWAFGGGGGEKSAVFGGGQSGAFAGTGNAALRGTSGAGAAAKSHPAIATGVRVLKCKRCDCGGEMTTEHMRMVCKPGAVTYNADERSASWAGLKKVAQTRGAQPEGE